MGEVSPPPPSLFHDVPCLMQGLFLEENKINIDSLPSPPLPPGSERKTQHLKKPYQLFIISRYWKTVLKDFKAYFGLCNFFD